MSESVREKCPMCGALEIEASSPRTVYVCGSSDYDQRPGTFEQSDICKATVTSSIDMRLKLRHLSSIVMRAQDEVKAAELEKCVCSSFVRQYEQHCCCNAGRIQAAAYAKLKESVNELVEYVTGGLCK